MTSLKLNMPAIHKKTTFFKISQLALVCSTLVFAAHINPAIASAKKKNKDVLPESSTTVAAAATAPIAAPASSVDTTPRIVDNKNPQAKDLMEIYQLAASYDPNYYAAKGAYIAGRENYWQGLAALMPKINATYNTSQQNLQYDPGTQAGNGYPPARTIQSTAWSIQLTQPLINWTAWETYRSGDFLTGLAENNFLQAQEDLIIRVTQAYFNVLYSQDTLDLYRNKKDLIKQQLDQAKRNFEVGTATVVDADAAQARYDLVVAQEIAAISDLDVKKKTLETLIGEPIIAIRGLNKTPKLDIVVDKRKIKYAKKDKATEATEEIAKSMNLPTGQTMEDWVKQSEEVNYNVLAAKFNLAYNNSQINLAAAGHAPTLNLVGSYGWNTVTANLYNSVPVSNFSNVIGLQLNVPIFSGGYTQSNVRQAVGLRDQAQAQYDLARNNTSVAARQAYLGFTSGLAQIKAYETAEASALKSLNSFKLGFEVGVNINIDVLNAQDQLFTTRANLYQSRYNTIVNGLTLKSLAAVLSDEDLKVVNGFFH